MGIRENAHCHTMMALDEHAIVDDTSATPSPGSPPGMTASKSSKSSSFHSLNSDDGSVDASHFEDIGLNDDTVVHRFDRDAPAKANPFNPNYPADLRAASRRNRSIPRPSNGPRELGKSRSLRDITPKSRPSFPPIGAELRSINVRSTNLNTLYPAPLTSPIRSKSFGTRGATLRRQRSQSPNCSMIPRDPNKLLVQPRRSSWQSTHERKSVSDLERECEDDDDDIPEHLILDNVPISPRPQSERSVRSRASSKDNSPERPPPQRVRSVGNGTPPVAMAQGSLKSPTWKSNGLLTTSPTAMHSMASPTSTPSSGAVSPVKTRTKSWHMALADLNAEAKALTEKLEEHADELQQKSQQRCSTGSMPTGKTSSESAESKARHKSALPELPPLRRSNIMIDPLPVSKEKEAVLSRTRPSWLPPKDPAEERRHLKEYQRMMAQSAEADKRRETARKLKSECRDTAVDTLMQIWERDVLPRWNEAICERRTRELWWKGVAPRSRGAVWMRAIGNELGLSETSYRAALRRAGEAQDRDAAGKGTNSDQRFARWLRAIHRDVESSTWTELKIFQKGAPLHQSLVDVLSAYAMYRSDIGYVPGCNTMAALLLLNLPSATEAFIALANLLNRPLPLSFYAADPGAKSTAYSLILQTLAQKSPSLHEHLTRLPDHDPDMYLSELFTSLFTGYLPLDAAARLWDVYVFEGDKVLVRAAVALLTEREMSLLGAKQISDVRAVLEGGSPTSAPGAPRKQHVVGRPGEEDAWIRAVREVGKA
ncbi:hypothetical protein RB597_010442 [Gaeumannomyces tritici]